MEIHIFKQYYGAPPLCKTSTRFNYSNICGARKRQVPIEQTRLPNLNERIIIYSGVNFCRKNVCDIFGTILFLMIAGKIAKVKKLAKILYHTVLSSVKPISHMINEMAREHW